MPRVKLFNEEEVLTKAMNLFWKQGYAATSIQDLVTHLGINRASIYDTYGDKKQLFKKSFELYRKTNYERLKLFFQNHPNIREGIPELFNSAVKSVILDKDTKGCFAVNTTTELIPNDETMVEILASNKRDFETLFYKYLKNGEQDGQLKKGQDLKAIGTLLYIVYNGLLVVSKVEPNETEIANSINAALSFIKK